MSGKFFVLDSKRILVSVLMISILTTICIIGSNLVSNTIETAMSERLLPIYSVETPEKKVALTFDCAWGADDIPSIIDTLQTNEVYDTFFTVGTWVDKYPDAAKSLILKLEEFKSVIAMSAQNRTVYTICRYVQELAAEFHSFYNSTRVITDDKDITKAILSVIYAFKTVLANALGLICVTAPERM